MNKNSNLLRLLIVVIIIFTMVAISSCTNNQDSIWVTGLDEAGNYEPFSFSIKNKRLLMTGTINKFSISYGKEKFFDELKKAYETFRENEDRIQLVYNGEVYTIRSAESYYELYGEYFIFEKDENVYYFPFPTDKIVGMDAPIPRLSSNFHVSCDIQYLRQFYEVYGNAVRIDENTIYYKNLSIKVGINNQIEVVVP